MIPIAGLYCRTTLPVPEVGILANFLRSMVAMTSLAFGIVGLIACACCKDVDKKMNEKVLSIPPSYLVTQLTVKQIEVYLENTQYADRNKTH